MIQSPLIQRILKIFFVCFSQTQWFHYYKHIHVYKNKFQFKTNEEYYKEIQNKCEDLVLQNVEKQQLIRFQRTYMLLMLQTSLFLPFNINGDVKITSRSKAALTSKRRFVVHLTFNLQSHSSHKYNFFFRQTIQFFNGSENGKHTFMTLIYFQNILQIMLDKKKCNGFSQKELFSFLRTMCFRKQESNTVQFSKDFYQKLYCFCYI